MATINIITANLNAYGDSGRFEKDLSTWGFGSPPEKVISRSALRKHTGVYSAMVRHASASSPSESTGVKGSLYVPPGSVGKTYLLRAKVFAPDFSDGLRTMTPIAADGSSISLKASPIGASYHTLDDQFSITKTIAEAKNTWVEISAVVIILQDYIISRHFEITVSGSHIQNGYLFVDDFEIFQVEIIDDPEPSCTIDLDEHNTVVIDESAPDAGDGSIDGAVTGSDGPFEWSIDGESWQSSSLFTGLSAGTYTLRVREMENPACSDSYVFAVNAGAIDFDFTIALSDETIAGAGNGSAVITPTGSGGPWTYSKDGGATFQTSNSFQNLTPGTYTFVVKDSNGNSAVKTATINAGAILFEKAFFSRNPIPFSVNAQAGYDELTNYRIYCDTRVEEKAGTGEFISRLTQALPANSEGKAVFNLRPAFRNVLSAVPPSEPTSTIKKLTDRLKWFKNYTGHLQDDQTVPAALTASNPFIVLLGGLSKYHYPSINYLTTYLQANKKFLTWAPVVKEVTRTQEDYLNFFVYSAAVTMLKLQVKVYYDDNTSVTQVIASTTCKYGELYQIPAGTSNTSVMTISPEKNPVKYEISLLDQSDSLISEVRTYLIDRVSNPRTRYLMFLNSLGGYEVHRFTGQTRAEEQYSREVIQKFLPMDYEALSGEFEINDVQGRRIHSFSSGYFKGQYADQWLDYMRDLIRATRFFDVTSSVRMPMVITNTNLPLKEDQNYLRFVRFQAQEVYFNENYTPDEI